MSRFYGTIDGSAKTQATRRGHHSLTTHAASWNGAIRVELYVDDSGKECFTVSRVPWRGHGREEELVSGSFD